MHPVRFGGGIGRHAGLKIPWAAMPVRVRFPSEARKGDWLKVDRLIGQSLFYFPQAERLMCAHFVGWFNFRYWFCGRGTQQAEQSLR